MTTARFHGVLLTYRRPDDVRNFLGVLERQTVQLDSLVVVDNDDDPAIAEIVDGASPSAGVVRYRACSENMGPAGGIDAGVAEVLGYADDTDWVVLLDDDDPPQRDDCLAVLRTLLAATTAQDRACAGIGLWGAVLKPSTGRLRAVGDRVPQPVDYLPGSALPHYSVGALRRLGPPEPAMFFGFDDLELGLRIRDDGLRLYSSGVARDHGLAHMVEGRTASAGIEAATWRRYYSLRNLIVVLRRHDATRGAVFRSLVAGIAKPLVNLPRSPRAALAHLALNQRAIRDGWRGRLGKTIDPAGQPAPRRNAAPR